MKYQTGGSDHYLIGTDSWCLTRLSDSVSFPGMIACRRASERERKRGHESERVGGREKGKSCNPKQE